VISHERGKIYGKAWRLDPKNAVFAAVSEADMATLHLSSEKRTSCRLCLLLRNAVLAAIRTCRRKRRARRIYAHVPAIDRIPGRWRKSKLTGEGNADEQEDEDRAAARHRAGFRQ